MIDLIKIESLGLAITATGLDLIKCRKCPARNEIEQILKMNLYQFEIPDLWISDIVSLIIRVGEISDSESFKESPLQKVGNEKKEYKVYSHESPDGEEDIKVLFEQINSSQDEDLEFKYTMFTAQDVRENIEDTLKGGKKLTEKWHSTLQGFYPRLSGEFLFILDFANENFYYNGKELLTSTDPKVEYNYYKALALILMFSKGTQITFEDLYQRVTGLYNKKKARITTQHWFTVLKHRLGVKKKDLNRLFKSLKKCGYEVVKEGDPKFFVLLEKSMVQNITKFSKS